MKQLPWEKDELVKQPNNKEQNMNDIIYKNRVMLFYLRRKKMDQNFYYCRHCGNIVVKVNDSGVPVMCCGEAMGVLLPNTSDGTK